MNNLPSSVYIIRVVHIPFYFKYIFLPVPHYYIIFSSANCRSIWRRARAGDWTDSRCNAELRSGICEAGESKSKRSVIDLRRRDSFSSSRHLSSLLLYTSTIYLELFIVGFVQKSTQRNNYRETTIEPFFFSFFFRIARFFFPKPPQRKEIRFPSAGRKVR